MVMGLNKLKGAGKEVEAAFFLFKAASLEKVFTDSAGAGAETD